MQNNPIHAQSVYELPIEIRIEKARQLWEAGAQAVERKQWQQAWQLYTEAHDLITDCAQLHQQSHEKLRVVNWKLGNYGELFADWALHCLAPLGVFALVARKAKSQAWRDAHCHRGTAA